MVTEAIKSSMLVQTVQSDPDLVRILRIFLKQITNPDQHAIRIPDFDICSEICTRIIMTMTLHRTEYTLLKVIDRKL